MAKDPLATYRAKRSFERTPEPAGREMAAASPGGSFVIQKHWATRLHYDFRLELDGVMKSWAVPKGPSLDPRDKRMAIATEDHPMEYSRFDGQIPAGQYGAGRVVIWDNGFWQPVGDVHEGLAKGDLKFELRGHKLRGRWVLVRTGPKPAPGVAQPQATQQWLLIKERDAYVRSHDEYDVLEALPDAVPALAVETEDKAENKAELHTSARGKPAALPTKLEPQLAAPVSGVPADADQRLWEIKLDGYRLLARIDAQGRATLRTRNAQDWTARFPVLALELEALKLRSAWFDGELVALNEQGLPSFEALQAAIAAGDTAGLVYFVFDLPFVNGEDWRAVPLVKRREKLEALVRDPRDAIRLSQTFDAPPSQLAAASKAAGLEGLIGKRIDAVYRAGRSDAWVKLKHGHHEEFVIAGYTAGEGGRAASFGALVLASHDEHGVLRHAGNVGSGFSEQTLVQLTPKLQALKTRRPTLDDPHKDLKAVTWVKPELVAQLSFSGVSRDGRIKHAVFRGLREDKPADEVHREHAKDLGAPSITKTPTSTLVITHPQRVIDDSSSHTKRDLVRYYERVAPLMMEHLTQRPVAWLRAPEGLSGETFFQKHLDRGSIQGVVSLAGLSGPKEPILEVQNAAGLAGAAQMNVIEFHTWNARSDDLLHPDRFILDLDPGEGLPWPQVQEAALLLRALLVELELPVFLKTSGGKGLHLVVPLKREHEWATVRSFAQALAHHVAAIIPQRFTTTSGARNRLKKVFIDVLRNSRGATTVCAWSLRARPGLGVSVPIGWDELSRVTSGAHWALANIDERLRVGNGPWLAYADSAVSLDAAIERLGVGHKDPT